MTENYSFGNWIKRRRKALDLTQSELARRVGCSMSTIVKIEADERRPSRQMAALLADHLQVEPDRRALFIQVARREKMVERLDPAPPLPPFSPPTVSQQTPNNLPVFPTSFVGREHETDLVGRQLLNPACRLLTLTGLGGVGKTRLAVEVGQRLESQFPDGVFFLSMASVDLLDSLAPTLADAIGVVFSGPADPLQQVINALGTKKMLLILDNMEHLVDESRLLTEILRRAPTIKLLLTSREPMHLQWEWVFEVQGLPVPEQVNAQTLETSSVASLFIQRARRVSQSFAPNPQEAATLLHICKLVDGMPLAIELAASWVGVLPLAEIAHELERSLDLLEAGMQDLPDRHRSIRASFEYSWKLLDGAERDALIKLSAFSGGFTRDTAEEAADVSLRTLSSLLSKSLLRHRRQNDRYEFHQLIRQYAAAELGAHPAEQAGIEETLAHYFSQWIADEEAPLKSARQVSAAAQIRLETANWMAAWRWSVQNRRLDLLRPMIPCLYWYYEIHGAYSQARHTYQFAVSHLCATGAPDCLSSSEEVSTYAFLVDQLAWFNFRTGRFDEARRLFADSLQLALPGQDAEVLYHIYGNWGYLELQSENSPDAKDLTLKSLNQARILGSQWHEAIPISVLGIVELQQGNAEAAYRQLSESLKIWRQVGDPRGLVFSMLYVGAAATVLNKMETAEAILQEGHDLAQAKMDHWAQAFSLQLLGQIAMVRAQPATAYRRFKESHALFREIGDQWGSTRALIHLADSMAEKGDWEGAGQLFRQAYFTAREAGWIPVIIEALVTYARIDPEIPPTKRLAIALDVLTGASNPPHVRQHAERLRDEALAQLTPQQIAQVRAGRGQTSPEAWAEQVFPTDDLITNSEFGVD